MDNLTQKLCKAFFTVVLINALIFIKLQSMSIKQFVIFDLGGVLLREAETNLDKAKSEQLQKILSKGLSPTRIFNRSFEFAAVFCGQQCKLDWLVGAISGYEIVTKLKEHIDKKEYESFFKNQYERNLIKHGIEYILLPNLLVELTELIPEGFEFIKKCKRHGIGVGIISNWDPESFELLKNKYPEFLGLFNSNTIIIPQAVGTTKPSPEIYEYALKRCGIAAQNCFFVDDSLVNVQGAQQCGIASVLHKDWHNTQTELIKLGLRFA